MSGVFDTEDCRGWAPSVGDVLAGSEEFVVIPVPVRRNIRGSQGETGEMKPHPGAAMFHVLLERLSLRGNFRASVQEKNDLVMRKKIGVQIVPIGGCFIREMIFFRLLREPFVCLFNETDMGEIVLAGVKGDYLE